MDLFYFEDIPTTKQDIANHGQELAARLLEDDSYSPLQLFVRFRALKDMLDSAMLFVQADAIIEADVYSEQDRTIYGVEFKIRSGRRKYDYTSSGDSTWTDLNQHERMISQQRKAREQFLRSLTHQVVDPTTGEIIEPPRFEESEPVLALYFPKN